MRLEEYPRLRIKIQGGSVQKDPLRSTPGIGADEVAHMEKIKLAIYGPHEQT